MLKSITTEGKEYEHLIQVEFEKQQAELKYKNRLKRLQNKKPIYWPYMIGSIWFGLTGLCLGLTILMNFDLIDIVDNPIRASLLIVSMVFISLAFLLQLVEIDSKPSKSRFKSYRKIS
tara:strand:+ start:238 stop:591 length:354 start_codon:yes stop_codon:yes gene_type:complete